MKTEQLISSFVTKLEAKGVPVRAEDNSSLLGDLERRLPKRLPQSLELFMSRYSFPSFDMGGISFFGWGRELAANEYFGAASAAKGTLSELLIPAGYFQLGQPETGDFDAVCIDFNGKGQGEQALSAVHVASLAIQQNGFELPISNRLRSEVKLNCRTASAYGQQANP
jgi:hypothetical protein